MYTELKKLSLHKNSRKKLRYVKQKILQFMAFHYSISASELSKNFSYSRKSLDYGNAKKYLRELRELGLIERDYKRKSINVKATAKGQEPNYYKLSKYGVYNLITNNENLQFEITKRLLLMYNDHVLFGFFLFPYIERETLANIVDSNIFFIIFQYLHDCCKQFEETLQNIKQTYNQDKGNLTSQLFVWQNIPDVHRETESLRAFLINEFKWHWVDRAEIKKTEDGNGITITYGLKSALISTDKIRKKAILSFRGKKKEPEFIIRDLGTDNFAIDIPTQPLEETYLRSFLISHIVRIPNFIISLIPLYGTPDNIPPFIEILAQDKRFTQILRKVNNKFDEKCNLIISLEEKSFL